MVIKLVIEGLPHCPRNRSHTILRKGKASFLGKTEAARMYEQAIKQELANRELDCTFFKNQFDKNKHVLWAEWIFYSPDLLTKDGRVSMNSTDLDAHKVLQDTVMEVVGIDDAYIVGDFRQKRQGEYRVELILTMKEF